MRIVGEDLLAYLQLIRERLTYVGQHAKRWSIEVGDEVIEALFLPRTEPLTDEPSAAVGQYIRAQELENIISAIVYPDRRRGGYGIGRYEDHPQLDFSRIEQETDVHFAHKSGFMCKTSAIDPDRLKALIRGAWSPG